MLLRSLFFFVILVTGISGCSNQLAATRNLCIEKVGVVGLCETEKHDKYLEGLANGSPYKGGLIDGKEYVVTKPLMVYRVWDKSATWSQYSKWWSFDKPEGPIDSWRRKFNVCSDPKWGAHNVFSKCLLKVDTKVVIGTGQSIKCDSETLPSSESTQVYIPNKLVSDEVYVENCETNPWP